LYRTTRAPCGLTRPAGGRSDWIRRARSATRRARQRSTLQATSPPRARRATRWTRSCGSYGAPASHPTTVANATSLKRFDIPLGGQDEEGSVDNAALLCPEPLNPRPSVRTSRDELQRNLTAMAAERAAAQAGLARAEERSAREQAAAAEAAARLAGERDALKATIEKVQVAADEVCAHPM
jgi:hypothetical protein